MDLFGGPLSSYDRSMSTESLLRAGAGTSARATVILVYAFMCAIWGTSWLAIKVSLQGMGPLTAVGLRFLIAGMLLFAVAVARREARPLRKLPWKLIAIYTVFTFAGDYTLVYVAETHVDSGITSVLFSTLPFFTFGFARLLTGERVDGRILLGSAGAFVGVVLISLTGGIHGSPLFALCAVGAAVAAAFATAYSKRYRSLSALTTLPPAMTIAGGGILLTGLLFEHTDWNAAVSASSLAALLYLAIAASGVAFCCMLWLLERLPAATVGMASLTFPVIAVFIGVVFGGEHFDARELLGSLLVLSGMAIALVPFPRAATVAKPVASCDKQKSRTGTNRACWSSKSSAWKDEAQANG
jgi:putative membrane protein PagO